MVKLIIFDLDGVLVNAKHIHFNALNIALSEVNPSYMISEHDHLSLYDGLKTFQKLNMLSQQKGLPKIYHNQIWNRKQELTYEEILKLNKSKNLIELFSKLKSQNYLIACCSNSIKKSVSMMLSKIGIIDFMDLVLSNEDVQNPKPHPEIYWEAMSELNVYPDETLIIEDSPPGLYAANKSGANVLRVDSPSDLSINLITEKINTITNKSIPIWQGKNMNILIPMAGAGNRFQQAGYTFPKPLIEVNGKPMIQLIVENINIDANYIFVVQREHRIKYNLDTLLKIISPNCTIVETDGITEGAACTTLLAKEFINNDFPLLIANSDQIVEWNSNEFMYKVNEQKLDAAIVTFNSIHPKWSFVKLNDDGYAIEVAEKNPISNIATCGIYYWAHGKDYVKYAEQMINNNIRTNNEFYVCPVFNEAINDDKKIKTFNIEKMWGLGTPEDLKYYLENYKNR